MFRRYGTYAIGLTGTRGGPKETELLGHLYSPLRTIKISPRFHRQGMELYTSNTLTAPPPDTESAGSDSTSKKVVTTSSGYIEKYSVSPSAGVTISKSPRDWHLTIIRKALLQTSVDRPVLIVCESMKLAKILGRILMAISLRHRKKSVSYTHLTLPTILLV